jgi:hypothetical protein
MQVAERKVRPLLARMKVHVNSANSKSSCCNTFCVRMTSRTPSWAQSRNALSCVFPRYSREPPENRTSSLKNRAEGRALLEQVRPLAVAREVRLLDGIDPVAFKANLERLMLNAETMLEEA